MNERTLFLKELIRWSTKATLLLPSSILNDEIDKYNKFKKVRDSLDYLKNDEKVLVTEKEMGNDLTEITLELKEG